MPLFEVDQDSLKALRKVSGGPELYEKEIEQLVWSDLEAMTGEPLFPVARQPTLSGGGRPDILALDNVGSVVVIEVKRDIDRSQLAQALEYAGWARTTSLDELAGLYHRGHHSFFEDWQDYTESMAPVLVNKTPRLILVARDFQDRTRSAIEFLQESRLPVAIVPVVIYAHPDGRRFVDVGSDYEPTAEQTSSEGLGTRSQFLFRGRRVQVSDLLEAGLLNSGEVLEFPRPRLGQLFSGTVLTSGSIEVDGVAYSTPSSAAAAAVKAGSFDGWYAWRAPSADGALLSELRLKFLQMKRVTEPG